MVERDVLDTGREFLMMTLQIALPILMAGLVAGVLVSIFQAVTQIQEFTLTFVPKLIAVIGALVVFGPWMLGALMDFFVRMFTHPISG